MKRYIDLNHDEIAHIRDGLRLDVLYAREDGSRILVSKEVTTALALLLEELIEIARYAPGGHGLYIDTASYWVEALAGADAKGSMVDWRKTLRMPDQEVKA